MSVAGGERGITTQARNVHIEFIASFRGIATFSSFETMGDGPGRLILLCTERELNMKVNI